MKLNDIKTIKNTLAKEAEAKKEKTALEAVESKDILDMIQDVYDGKVVAILDADDNIIGINCPTGSNVAKCVKTLGGHIVMGENLDQMAQDEAALKGFLKAYEGQDIQHMFECALKIQGADLHPEYAEEHFGVYYFVVNELKKVIDEDGKVIVDLADQIPGEINDNLLTSILVDKLHLVVQEMEEEIEDLGFYEEDEDEFFD